MGTFGALTLSGLVDAPALSGLLAKDGGTTAVLTLPQQKQVNWQAAELGMIFHYDISIFGNRLSNNNTYKGGYDPAIWNPSSLDTDQWLRIAKATGCRYAVFTATHFQGFLNWSSDLYPFGMKQVPWKNGKGDLVEQFINSCHKYGLLPGLYMSTHCNFYHQVDNFRVNWGKGGSGQAAYNALCVKMAEELCSRYGKLFELWFDAGNLTPAEGGPDVLPVVDKYQPDTIYYKSNQRRDHRWCGSQIRDLPAIPAGPGPPARTIALSMIRPCSIICCSTVLKTVLTGRLLFQDCRFAGNGSGSPMMRSGIPRKA
jgi:alpha-L-fucosidase